MDKSAEAPYASCMHRTLRTIVKPEVQNILDHFCYSFNIRIVLYTPDGGILRVGLDRPDSPFCRLVRRLYGEARCLTLDDSMRHEAARRADLVCYRCHAGLEESIDPISVRGVLIGYAMIGQFRAGETIAPHVLDDWEERFGSSSALRAAFASLPSYDSVTRDHIVGLFRVLVEYVVSKELIQADGNLLVERIKAYVERNTHRPISLEEVARATGKSCSTISHAVRTHCRCTFKQLTTESKIREAERLMTENPDIAMRVVAETLGYSDQFYFSRAYRRLRGFPPSHFVKGRLRPA